MYATAGKRLFLTLHRNPFKLNTSTGKYEWYPHPKPSYDVVRQIDAALRVKALESRAGELNSLEIMTAVSNCISNGLIAPKWLAVLFSKRLQPVLNLGVSSWDDPRAFGRPFAKGKKVATMRHHKNLRLKVVRAVRAKLFNKLPNGKKLPVDRIFWETVAKEVNSNRTLVEKLYRDYLKAGGMTMFCCEILKRPLILIQLEVR
jgi:hypothetical protein